MDPFFLFLAGKSYVTSIQHGGSVTLVSLSGGDDHVVHYDRDWGASSGGSHTLPRRKPQVVQHPHPHPSSTAGNGVKIRINGSASSSVDSQQHSYGFSEFSPIGPANITNTQ